LTFSGSRPWLLLLLQQQYQLQEQAAPFLLVVKKATEAGKLSQISQLGSIIIICLGTPNRFFIYPFPLLIW
jgi:hypothetical protein